MPKETDAAIQASDLPVVQYLNQRITFDLLATLEDGFSHLTTIETQASDSSSTRSSLQGGVTSGFLGISFGGGMSGTEEDAQREIMREELVHTPSSLFAQLRNELKAKELVKEVSNPDSLCDIRNGEFVEFEATLHRIQIIEVLNTLEFLLPLGEAFDESSIETNKGRRGKGRRGKVHNGTNQQPNRMLEQVRAIRMAISGAGSQDLVAKVGGMNFILTVADGYFIDPTMSDVLDGTFRVFGKVTRVITSDSESINLLRMSPLSKFPQAFDEFASALTSAEFFGGMSGGTETNIFGPTLQIIPIGIFA